MFHVKHNIKGSGLLPYFFVVYCHPECNEGFFQKSRKFLHFVQNDRLYKLFQHIIESSDRKSHYSPLNRFNGDPLIKYSLVEMNSSARYGGTRRRIRSRHPYIAGINIQSIHVVYDLLLQSANRLRCSNRRRFSQREVRPCPGFHKSPLCP